MAVDLKRSLSLFSYVRQHSGIGLTRTREIILRLGIKNKYVSVDQISQKAKNMLDELLVDYCSRRQKPLAARKQAIIKFQKAKTRRGKRHSIFLPVRGQRTHTNAKTRKRRKIY
jgi:small subunit ribosomal protein S13